MSLVYICVNLHKNVGKETGLLLVVVEDICIMNRMKNLKINSCNEEKHN